MTAANANATALTLTPPPPPNNLERRRRAATRPATCAQHRIRGALTPFLAILLAAPFATTPNNAQAQTTCPTVAATQETVCNLDRGISGSGLTVGGAGNTRIDLANAFTTGDAAGGYTLQSVRVRFGAETGAPGDISVAIHSEASGGGIGASIATLSGANPSTAGVHEFTASGVSLAASTTYFLVLTAPDASSNSDRYSASITTSVQQSGSDNWEIGDRLYARLALTVFSESSTNQALSFAVIANPVATSIIATPTALALDETGSGNSGEYTLVLGTAPTADVTVTPSIAPTGVAALTPAALTFTSANWSTAQTVSVTATDDDIDNAGDERSATISHAVATTDTDYTALTGTALPSVAVAVTDISPPPVPTLTLAPSKSAYSEGSDDAIAFRVTASEAPASALTLSVTLTGADDFIAAADRTQTITLASGATSATARFPIQADEEDDAPATATATLTIPTGYQQSGSALTATARIFDGANAELDARITADSGAAIARAIVGIANAAIASRIEQATAGGVGNFNLADSAGRLLANGGDVKPMLNGAVLALSGGSRAAASPSFWASGDYRDIGGGSKNAGGTLDWAGDVASIQLGADAKLPNGLLLGAAASRSRSDIDYTADDESTGSQEVTLTSLHPYIAHRTAAGVALWATLARGEGELDRSGESATNDVTLSGIALGASGVIGRGAHSEWRLSGEVQTAEMTFDGAAADGSDLDVTASRARFGAQWSDAKQLADATMRRALSFHLRHDDGDGIAGRGFELAARIARADANGATASAHARALLTHNRDYDEWGVGAQVRYAPGADGQGFNVRMEPSLGATDSRADELLHGDDALADQSFDPTARMDGEIGYGIAYRAGMMTPYSGFRFVDGGRDYRIGTRYKLRPIPLEMGLEAYRRDRAAIENGVLLEARIRW